MTEESQQPVNSVSTPTNNTLTPEKQINENTKSKSDNKKEKCKPMTKVVIRRLPPSMTQAQFIEQVSPLPDHDYLYFVKADMSLGQHAFSRAYINFTDQKDIFGFREKFDNYVFVDSKGTEYPAVVEFAPFQRLPKKRVGRKKDIKCGTIDADPYYIAFLESLKNKEADSGASQPKTEYSYQPTDNALKRVTTTPLLEYLKQRKMEKQRARDEKREERRRRDLERRRAKDEPTISKVLRNPDTEVSRENKENKDDKERLPKDQKNRRKDDKVRDKVVINRDGKMTVKSYKDDRKPQERDGKYPRKNEDKKTYNRRDDNYTKEDKKSEGKNTRDSSKDDTREQREKRMEEKKGKSYEKMRQEKRRFVESKKQTEDNAKVLKGEMKKDEAENIKGEINTERSDETVTSVSEVAVRDTGNEKDQVDEKTSKISVSEESKDEGVSENLTESSIFDKSNDFELESHNDCPKLKKNGKLQKRRSSLESGGEGGGGDGAQLRRHKSLDGEDQGNLQKNENDDKDKDKKDPRRERRIRNKDRPAMEIYRPGMGKFSKQRLEREKSSQDDRASLSESPTNNSSDQKSELRSMTFKRSVSRDN